jgi:type I restriction enzyme R subunit
MDERIDASVRKLMEPVSVLDEDFEEKVAALPHDESRASVMEHALRAYINTRLADNPVFFEKLSEQLERIIRDLHNQVIDAAEAARRAAEVKRQLHAEDDIAAEHGLSPVSFAIYELIRTGPYGTENGDDLRGPGFEQDVKDAALAVEEIIEQRGELVEWQSNPEARRLMRRDIKRVLRPSGNYSEDHLDELAARIVELAQRRNGR